MRSLEHPSPSAARCRRRPPACGAACYLMLLHSLWVPAPRCIAEPRGALGARASVPACPMPAAMPAFAACQHLHQLTDFFGQVPDASAVVAAVDSLAHSLRVCLHRATICNATLPPAGTRRMPRLPRPQSTASPAALRWSVGGGGTHFMAQLGCPSLLPVPACRYQTHASAAKAAVDSITRSLALEWGAMGIRVNGVAPGPIEDTAGGHIKSGNTGAE